MLWLIFLILHVNDLFSSPARAIVLKKAPHEFNRLSFEKRNGQSRNDDMMRPDIARSPCSAISHLCVLTNLPYSAAKL